MLVMKRLRWLFFVSWLLPSLVFGAVTKLEFTTDPRTVAPGAISEVLTVQTQDSSGAEAKMEETGDMTFVSTSASGEFLNASGGPVSTVMNRNSANRNFYYRDSVAGNQTLTVTVTGRESGTTWSTSQAVTIGAGGPADGGDDDDEAAPEDDDDDSPSDASGGQTTSTSAALSAHASQTPLGQVASGGGFKVGAGRTRLTAIRSPIVFWAETSGAKPDRVRYTWSFGDGGFAIGEKVRHGYSFPGEYVVILNATGADDETAVTRTTVSVIEPSVAFGQVTNNGLELINQSSQELNLGGWRLEQNGSRFVFPPDTLLSGKRRLTIPADNLKFIPVTNLPTTLFFPDGTLALASSSLAAVTPPPAVSPVDAATLVKLNQSFNNLAAELRTLKSKTKSVASVAVAGPTGLISPPVVATTTPVNVPETITIVKPPNLLARVRGWFSQ